MNLPRSFGVRQSLTPHHSFIQSFIPSFSRSFIHSFTHSLIHSFVRPLINSVIPAFVIMALRSISLCLAFIASFAVAWIPGEHREIYNQDGTNLFNVTSLGYGNSTTKRWLQTSGKIRGVNLGSLFVFEPWLAETEWSAMGCAGQNSEFDCVSLLGQAQANSVFQSHWGSWITQSDSTYHHDFSSYAVKLLYFFLVLSNGN